MLTPLACVDICCVNDLISFDLKGKCRSTYPKCSIRDHLFITVHHNTTCLSEETQLKITFSLVHAFSLAENTTIFTKKIPECTAPSIGINMWLYLMFRAERYPLRYRMGKMKGEFYKSAALIYGYGSCKASSIAHAS